MKRFYLVILISLTASFTTLDSQPSGFDLSSALRNLFTRLVTITNDSVRIEVNDSIRMIIDDYARSDSVFEHKFNNLKYLGQITSKNSQLKILTWNLLLKDSNSKYYCYFINRSAKGNQVYELETEYKDEPVRSDVEYTNSNWYGALYYDLRAAGKGNQPCWIILGIDYGNPSITRKIIDVVSFIPGRDVLFGKKIFSTDEGLKYREVFEYSSEAVMSLKFLNDKSIVFDHLVPSSPAFKGKKEFYGPDFSYDGYYLEKGFWKFKSNIEVRNRK